tara:strand:+ start:196 stop:408 length:213 start_codon:yes stop_codon:yes gene_type:complete
LKKSTKKILKGGSTHDIFSYSDCKNNPGSDGKFSVLGCDLGNVFTGIGDAFSNIFDAIGNTVELGEIMID